MMDTCELVILVSTNQTPTEAGPHASVGQGTTALCPRLCPPLVRCSLFRSWRGLSIISRSAADLVLHQTRAEHTPTPQSPSPELTGWRAGYSYSRYSAPRTCAMFGPSSAM